MREEVIKKIIEYFTDNDDVFVDCIEELDDCNGYLSDDRWYDMDSFEELMSGKDMIDVLNMAYFGRDDDSWHTDSRGEKQYDSFNPNRDYFSFNGYGNLISSNYKDYSDFLDEYFVEALEDNRRHIYAIDDDIDLSILFDDLEAADDEAEEEEEQNV